MVIKIVASSREPDENILLQEVSEDKKYPFFFLFQQIWKENTW